MVRSSPESEITGRRGIFRRRVRARRPIRASCGQVRPLMPSSDQGERHAHTSQPGAGAGGARLGRPDARGRRLRTPRRHRHRSRDTRRHRGPRRRMRRLPRRSGSAHPLHGPRAQEVARRRRRRASQRPSQHAEHDQPFIVERSRQRGATRIEATAAAEDAWVEEMRDKARLASRSWRRRALPGCPASSFADPGPPVSAGSGSRGLRGGPGSRRGRGAGAPARGTPLRP